MLIIHKYGGTSLADSTRIKEVAKRIKKESQKGDDLVIVVSAPSGMTNQLLEQASEICTTPSLREVDMMLTTGEQLSASLLSLALQDIGVDAISFNSFQINMKTTNTYGSAKLREIKSDRIFTEIAKKKVVVITGFQGINEHNDFTTLGRGGSDTTAVAIGVCLNADMVEIFTDVDGFHTADPRLVKNAIQVPYLSHSEALEMASLGAKIMHDRSVALAMKYGINLHVRNSYNDNKGTIIGEAKMEEIKLNGVAHSNKNALINIMGQNISSATIGKIFTRIKDLNINISNISKTQDADNYQQISMLLESDENIERFIKYKDEIIQNKDNEINAIEINQDVAKVSVVGFAVRTSGVFAQIWQELTSNNIDILMVSTSDLSISSVVKLADMEKAVQILHKKFFETANSI